MRKLQVPAGTDGLVNGYVVGISGQVLLYCLEPEGVDEHVKQASCQYRKQGGREFASLFDACGRFHLRVAALRMKAIL